MYSGDVTLKIKTSSGIIDGVNSIGVVSWNNIPYAQPPIGNLRWKAPRHISNSDKLIPLSNNKENFCVQEPSGLGGADGDTMIVLSLIHI